MTRKRREGRGEDAPVRPAAATTARPLISRGQWLAILIFALVIVAIAAGFEIAGRNLARPTDDTAGLRGSSDRQPAAASAADPRGSEMARGDESEDALLARNARLDKSSVLEPGPADRCRTYPDYARQVGFTGPVYISTNVRGYPGLVLVGTDSNGARKIYQHPSWTGAGYLAAFTYDRMGNIYVAPSPLVSLWENPPAEQNDLWRVDAATQEMSRFATLPPAAAPTAHNPFGVIGLAYDCDTGALYAASVMGSTPDAEVGRVYRIDIETAGVEVIHEGQDFFGLAVFNEPDGKRLFLGSARTSGVYSLPLTASGAGGQLRNEFHLSNFSGGANDRIKRIIFEDDGRMRVKGFDFQYTLKVASAYPHSDYLLERDSSRAWKLLSVRRSLAQ